MRQFLPWDDVVDICNEFSLVTVPALYQGPFDEKVLAAPGRGQEHAGAEADSRGRGHQEGRRALGQAEVGEPGLQAPQGRNGASLMGAQNMAEREELLNKAVRVLRGDMTAEEFLDLEETLNFDVRDDFHRKVREEAVALAPERYGRR
jgi:hypothetical protein